jgi:hypothetical protein
MERRHILLEATDGTDVSFMGYTLSNIRGEPIAVHLPVEPSRFVIIPVPLTASTPARWWVRAWQILNTDIFELWRTYGPKSIRRG